MCDPATAQRRLEELVEHIYVYQNYLVIDPLERRVFAALNAAYLAEGEHE